MKSISNLLFPLLVSTLLGCGGGGGGSSGPVIGGNVSTGLKIFVTAESHSGDFANDPTLTGATAMQKADDFCNKSASKPSNDTYKALLVDGVDRDAVAQIDWVLKPNTSYFQSSGNVLIDVTTGTATFASVFRAMPNAVLPPNCAGCATASVWTGIGDGGTFAASNSGTCARWGRGGSVQSLSGAFGQPTSNSTFAFFSNGGTADCISVPLRLYCVQQ